MINRVLKSVLLHVSRSEALLLIDGLRSMEYWDYATELDLPDGTVRSSSPKTTARGGARLPQGATKSMRLSRFDSCVNSPLGSSRRLARDRRRSA